MQDGPTTPGYDLVPGSTPAAPREAQRADDISNVAHQLGLTLGDVVGGGPTGAPVLSAFSSSRDVVLKWHYSLDDAAGEAVALSLLAAQGLGPQVARQGRVLVIDRIRPGTAMRAVWEGGTRPYGTIQDDLERIGDIIRTLDKIPPGPLTRPVIEMLSYDLAAWGGPLTPGGPDVTSVLPSGLVSDVLGAVDALGPSPGGPSLCHGDLHPGNLLWNGTNWVAIDPRAVIGDPCCDAGRVAVSTALWAGWDLEAALSTICSFSGGDPERTTAWSRAYLLQVLFYYWHFGDVDGPEARRRVERMLF